MLDKNISMGDRFLSSSWCSPGNLSFWRYFWYLTVTKNTGFLTRFSWVRCVRFLSVLRDEHLLQEQCFETQAHDGAKCKATSQTKTDFDIRCPKPDYSPEVCRTQATVIVECMVVRKVPEGLSRNDWQHAGAVCSKGSIEACASS